MHLRVSNEAELSQLYQKYGVKEKVFSLVGPQEELRAFYIDQLDWSRLKKDYSGLILENLHQLPREVKKKYFFIINLTENLIIDFDSTEADGQN